MSGRYMTWMERVDTARSLDLLEVIERLAIGEKMSRRGRQYVMLCPLHGEKSPSFYASPEKGVWNCFGCGQGGDGIELWMKIRGVGFADAVREMVP